MLVATILQGKGAVVHTIGPDEPVAMAVDRLTEHRIGALVVSGDGKTVSGIISERDIVRGLSTKGAMLLDEPVGSVMTSAVVTCTPEDTGHAVLSAMTERRMRHVPVVQNGTMCGLVSIGDVVKSRLDEVTHEADALREYISQT